MAGAARTGRGGGRGGTGMEAGMPEGGIMGGTAITKDKE